MSLNRFILVPGIHLRLLLLITLTSISTALSQTTVLDGKVMDSLNQPIPHTNLIASPYQAGESVSFAIADFDGKYKLNLQADVDYKIEITSMGYSSKIDSLRISKNTTKNYILKESTTALEQVVIKAKMAMVVREDTITYRTDKFITGDERKLRDVLKKLPGVEVDREGNVTVNGKKVDKLMVDGQDFFGGDTKLGVNHIPADAVDEVEAIDNYHEVAFMKGLSDSDRMAMNIKLKEDKKSFVFGETEAGSGDKDRYYVQPTLFYYSPNTTVNFIGSLNNINKSPLNFQDVIRFSGSDLSYMENTVLSSNE
ncbi:MAG TPA: carboxypeptidase-like regulatory domain-containing protein, partial [Flavobacteriaceae bacterium]|nr:carboxypeptidase-like regulatory domain-containing protein [Flavobacteriaceae bacterium]